MFKNPHLFLIYLALILIQALNVIDVAFADKVDLTKVLINYLPGIWPAIPELITSPAGYLLLNVVWLCLMVSVAPFLVIGKRWAGNIVIMLAIYQVSVGLYHFGASILSHVEFPGLFSGIAQGVLGIILIMEILGYWITRKAA